MTVSQSVISRSHPALTTPPALNPAPPLPYNHKYRVLAPGGYSIVASEVSLSQRTDGCDPCVPCVAYRSVAVQCPVCPVFVVPALPRSLLRVSHVPRRSPGVFFVFTVPYRFGTNTHTSDDHSTCMHAFHICSLSQTFPRTALQIEACASSPMLRLFPRKHTVNVPVTLLCL